MNKTFICRKNIYSVSSVGNLKGFPEERVLMLGFKMSRRYQGVNSKIKKKSLSHALIKGLHVEKMKS